MPDSLDFIHASGRLIAPSILADATQDVPHDNIFAPGAFIFNGNNPETPKAHAETIETAFDLACTQYDDVSRKMDSMELPDIRRRWLVPLMEILDFAPNYQRGHLPSRDGRQSFSVSHLGWEHPAAPPILLTNEDLDLPQEKRHRAPHDELQQYLNASDASWGVVSNGRRLRILRDFYHTKLKAFVGFDLDAIFETRDFRSFRALYRLAHRSRFCPNGGGLLRIETLFQQSQAQGVQGGRQLQIQVREAIEALADGLLDRESRNMLRDAQAARGVYHELLLVVYRILFLLFAEQRRMLPTDGLFAETYSLAALARVADSGNVERHHEDLWEGLKATFCILHKGAPEIDVFPYNGQLFDVNRTATFMGRSCRNENVVKAIKALTYIRLDNVRQRVNYAELGVEELGSVYESLLNYTLKVADAPTEIEGWIVPEGSVYLSPLTTERKDLGAFYTRPELVDFVLSVSLDRLIEERLAAAGSDRKKRAGALLDIRLCDPACGSGAFLVGAIDRIAMALSIERFGGMKPTEDALQRARRDVLRGCIYGVDKDQFAVELCKVALWIHCAVPDMPLSFLDHRIQHGDSLVGWPLLDIPKTIPNEAFVVPDGCDERLALMLKSAKEQNSDVLRGQMEIGSPPMPDIRVDFPAVFAEDERVPADVEKKSAAYEAYLHSPAYRRFKAAADLWSAAFFWSMEAGTPAPITSDYQQALNGDIKEQMANAAHDVLEELPAFHWPLRFPEIRARGGFDCVVGNPPWEQVKVNEQEWFIPRDTEIAGLPSAKRKPAIEALGGRNASLFRQWALARTTYERMAEFARNSGRYSLSGHEPNTYLLFSELCADYLNSKGRAGILVKSALGLDKSARGVFQKLVNKGVVDEFHDFVNGGGVRGVKIFPEVNEHVRFALVALDSQSRRDGFDYTSLNWTVEEGRIRPRVRITADMLSRFNPVTKTLLSYRLQEQFDVALQIHDKVPPFDCERGMSNPWQITITTLMHSSGKSGFFQRRENLEHDGWTLGHDMIFKGPSGVAGPRDAGQAELFGSQGEDVKEAVPLYEGQLVTRYDHRARTYAGYKGPNKYGKKPAAPYAKDEEKAWPDYEVEPRYWVLVSVANRIFQSKISAGQAIIALRKIAVSFADSRCAKACLIPAYPASDALSVVAVKKKLEFELLAILNSTVFDFLLRGHLPGSNVTLTWMLSQIPIPRPGTCSNVVERVRKLSLTSQSVAAMYDVKPYRWDRDERYQLDVEVDAMIAQSYGLTYSQYKIVLDSFEVLARQQIRDHGRYKFKDDCLEAYRRC